MKKGVPFDTPSALTSLFIRTLHKYNTHACLITRQFGAHFIDVGEYAAFEVI